MFRASWTSYVHRACVFSTLCVERCFSDVVLLLEAHPCFVPDCVSEVMHIWMINCVVGSGMSAQPASTWVQMDLDVGVYCVWDGTTYVLWNKFVVDDVSLIGLGCCYIELCMWITRVLLGSGRLSMVTPESLQCWVVWCSCMRLLMFEDVLFVPPQTY